MPTLFWLDASDGFLQAMAWLGVVLSLPVLLGFANGVLLAALWALYMSFVHVGQVWYGFGWEIQLLETGFLAIFLCPLLDPRPFPRRPPPIAIIWLLRWLTFRIMLGAGLIKLRGDSCWRDLTCLYYHYETQPIPNPLSRSLHFMPHWFNRCGVLFNHLTELVAPWFVFGPRPARLAAGVVMTAFQVFLILSGNLSFLNWLTVVPVLACFDDAFLARLLPGRLVRASRQAAEVARPSRAQQLVAGGVAALVAILSVAPVSNLLSGHQVMNTSFDPFDLVNTYGAFGSVGRERDEIVFEGTNDAVPDDDGRLAAVRVQVQARRSHAPAVRHRALPPPARLADLVRGHVDGPRPIPGPCTWSGSCSTATRGRLASWRTIRSPTRRRASSVPRSTAIASRRPAIRAVPGGRASASGRGSRRCRRAIAGSPPSWRATVGGPPRSEDQPPFAPSSRSWMSARRSTSSRWVSDSVSPSSPRERFIPARSSGSRRGSKPMSRAMRSAWCCAK